VFVEPASGWTNMTQTAELTNTGNFAEVGFGSSVAISGDTVVAGAPQAYVGLDVQAGAAYVFVEASSGWTNMTQTAELSASDGEANDALGTSVAIAGDTVVAGAPDAQIGANANQGAVYAFVEPASGWTNMTQTAKLTASDGEADDILGSSVAASGDIVVASAPVVESPPPGAVYVFESTPPSITTPPVSQTVKAGQTVSFVAAASGTPAPGAQWYMNSGSGFQSIAGATDPTYSFTALASMNGYQYEVVFTNSAGSITSQVVTLTVTPSPYATTIAITPSIASPTYGEKLTFRAQVNSASPTPPSGTVQFEVDGNDLGSPVTLVSGAATSILTSALGAGSHAVTVVYSGSTGFLGKTTTVNLDVAKAVLTVTAENESKVQNAPNPPLAYTITGFVNGDTARVVSGKPVLSTTATKSSKPGTYAITVKIGTLSAKNYVFSKLESGVLTIRKG
jgi:hypothetical protein